MGSKEITDVEFKLKPKNAAVAIQHAFDTGKKNFDVDDQRWEELEDIYQESAKGIVAIADQVNAALAMPGMMENIDNVEEVNLSVTGLKRDLEAFTVNLIKIHKMHEGKTGVIKQGGETGLSIEVFEEYLNHSTQFKSVTLPTVLTIMDHIGNACAKMTDAYEKDQAAKVAVEPPVA